MTRYRHKALWTTWECPEDLTGNEREQVSAWLREHDLDPGNIMHAVVLNGRSPGDGELHVTEKLLDENGNPLVDYAANAVVTRPKVMTLRAEPPIRSKP